MRDHDHGLDTLRRIEPRGGHRRPRSGADDEAAVERGGDVVGMPLELGGLDQDVLGLLGQLVEMVGGEQAGDDRRGARAQAGGQRDLALDPERDPVGGPQRLEGAHAEIGAVERNVQPLRLDRERADLLDLELEVHGERGRQHVIARAEIGR